MNTYRFLPEDTSEIHRSMREMYEEKTFDRLNEILQNDKFDSFRKDEIIINGERCIGLDKCIKLIPQMLDEVGMYEQKYFTIIHGDFCLSNILFDRKNGFIRVIDPRGEFGSFDIYGDFRYDLAKLSHSFEGGYDFIVNGLFDITISDDCITFNIHKNSHHKNIANIFTEWLLKRGQFEYRQIKLLESLLFLSMAPLHSDKPDSQRCFLAQGLFTFSSLMNPDKNSAHGVTIG
jgi:hypothetical protein